MGKYLNIKSSFYLLFLFIPAAKAHSRTDSLPEERIWRLAAGRYGAYIEQYPDSSRQLYSVKSDGSIQSVTYTDWTSGFFPGVLWKLYGHTKDHRWKERAARWTATLSPAQWLTSKHDLGFIIATSFGNGYDRTQDSAYLDVLHQAARSLATRFQPITGSIRSWDNGPWHYPVIVDNLMNLELLFRAASLFKDTSFRHIAVSHLNNELRYRFRADGSTCHVLDFDPASGRLLARKTWQGLNDSSCWARGQAWAIYGFAMAYRYTHITAYLQQSIRAARYFIRQVAAIPDHIPYWDFNDPLIPHAPRDVSAAAIAASALLELAKYDLQDAALYRQTATAMLESLCSDSYLAEKGAGNYFLLKHAVVNKPAGKGVDVPLIYADYYFLEALERY